MKQALSTSGMAAADAKRPSPLSIAPSTATADASSTYGTMIRASVTASPWRAGSVS